MPNGIFHPWVRWDGGVEVAGICFSSAAAAVAHPKSGCLVIIVFLRFLTHSRALNVLASR